MKQGIQHHCAIFTHAFGGGIPSLHFVCRLPTDSSKEELVQRNTTVMDKLKGDLPVYHTRAMHKAAVGSFGRICGVKPAFMRELYRKLTGDASSSHDAAEAVGDERLRLALDTEDPEIIYDLRHYNQGRPEKYQVFWEECKKYLNSSIDLAADERRHDTVTHLATALSVSDLHKQVSQQCPEGTPLPSEKWLLFQFWPKDVTRRTAYQYTGRLEVKFMIQSRQFRHHHIDAHYASALFR